jgi:hypothetical protein
VGPISFSYPPTRATSFSHLSCSLRLSSSRARWTSWRRMLAYRAAVALLPSRVSGIPRLPRHDADTRGPRYGTHLHIRPHHSSGATEDERGHSDGGGVVTLCEVTAMTRSASTSTAAVSGGRTRPQFRTGRMVPWTRKAKKPRGCHRAAASTMAGWSEQM